MIIQAAFRGWKYRTDRRRHQAATKIATMAPSKHKDSNSGKQQPQGSGTAGAQTIGEPPPPLVQGKASEVSLSCISIFESTKLCTSAFRVPQFAGLFTGHEPARGLRRGAFKISRVGSGLVRKFSKSYGSGQVTLTRPDPTRKVGLPREQL